MPPPPPERLSRAALVTRAVLLLCWPLAILWVAWGSAVAPHGICLFRILSGWLCPLCGGTTVCGHLLHGGLGAAWSVHPLVVIGLGLAAVHSLLVVAEMASRRILVPAWGWSRPWAWWGMATVLWWIWRLATGRV